MKRHEHLLLLLAEECAEVAQRASKAARFGLDDAQEGHNDGKKLTAAQRIKIEMIDLLAVWGMLCQEGHCQEISMFGLDNQLIEAKQARIESFMDYSEGRGTLQF